MVAFIEGHGLLRLPGYVTEDIPSVLWDGKDNPDAWKDFVEMAKHVGAPFITFSEMTLERDELDALIEEAGEMNFPDEEATELVEAQVAAQVRRHARLHSAWALSIRASSFCTKPPPSGTSATRRCLKTSRAFTTLSSTTRMHTATTRTSKPRPHLRGQQSPAARRYPAPTLGSWPRAAS